MKLKKLLKQSYSTLKISIHYNSVNFLTQTTNPKDSRVLVQMLVLFSVGHGAVF